MWIGEGSKVGHVDLPCGVFKGFKGGVVGSMILLVKTAMAWRLRGQTLPRGMRFERLRASGGYGLTGGRESYFRPMGNLF